MNQSEVCVEVGLSSRDFEKGKWDQKATYQPLNHHSPLFEVLGQNSQRAKCPKSPQCSLYIVYAQESPVQVCPCLSLGRSSAPVSPSYVGKQGWSFVLEMPVPDGACGGFRQFAS